MSAFSQLKSAPVFFLILVLANFGALVWWRMSPELISHESGPLENIQAVVLGVTFAAFYIHARKRESASKTVAVIFCFLCFFMFFREIDFRTIPVSDQVLSFTTGRPRKLMFWFALLLLAVYIVSRFTQIQKILPAILHWRAWPFYLWLALMFLGEKTEKMTQTAGSAFSRFEKPHGQFLEEMMELNGYLILLYAALNFSKIGKNIDAYAEHGSNRNA